LRDVRLGIDVGGTFTDLVALVDGRVVTAKVPSTPRDQADGVLRALAAAGLDTARVGAFAHGTTMATNALLERRGARTALVTTAGFRDVLEIGRQQRPALYDLAAARPPALVPRELRFTVAERMGPEGVLRPLDDGSLAAAVAAVDQAGVEAVAVCLLFSFLHPEHERRAGQALRDALGGRVAVSLSSEVLPEFREYERFSTTVTDAYLTPLLAAYLARLAHEAGRHGLPAPLVMQSSGGVIEAARAAGNAASCVLSGPAGGVVGAAWAAGLSGHGDLLTFDMGGTSTDVAPVVGGQVQTTTEAVVAGVPIKLPMVDVHSVSAGGGSVVWVDEGGALRVGPRSAGAEPGPAAYGRGGEDATVTDANLWLGYLPDGVELGGELVLSRELAERALARVGERLGQDVLDVALGVVRVANAEMVRALRLISVQRGLDPREFTLVAFGGAGPLHACALAEEMGIGRVLVPRASGVLSALGLAISDLRRDYVAAVLGRLDELDPSLVEDAWRELERQAVRELDGNGERPVLTRRADLRYRGQSFELTVEVEGPGEAGPARDAGLHPGVDLPALAERFGAAHQRRYGYRMDDEAVELVNLRLVAAVPAGKPEVGAEPSRGARRAGRRGVNLDGHWREVDVLGREQLGEGDRLQGPAVVEFAEATLLLRPGWQAVVDQAGTMALERAGGG
jgi:N-methylhydantoinase A